MYVASEYATSSVRYTEIDWFPVYEQHHTYNMYDEPITEKREIGLVARPVRERVRYDEPRVFFIPSQKEIEDGFEEIDF